jgi:proton-coupled amino acid transporter
MKEPEKFIKILKILIVIVVITVVALGSIAYAGFGENIQDIVTMNLPNTGISSFARIMYCFGLIGSYPIQLIPALEIIEKTTVYMKLPNPSLCPRVN